MLATITVNAIIQNMACATGQSLERSDRYKSLPIPCQAKTVSVSTAPLMMNAKLMATIDIRGRNALRTPCL